MIRKIKVTTIITFSKDVEQNEILDLKKQILSGSHQRDLMKDKNVMDAKATFEILK